MLQVLWEQLTYVEQLIERLNQRIQERMRPYEDQIKRLIEVPGIHRVVAQVLIAETGADMSQFPSAAHLASWAGMCPGNNESAGKSKSGKTTKGSRWLRQALVQAGWAASRSKTSYLAAQYKQLSRRRGRKRAVVAVGHSILVIAHHLLLKGQP